MKTAGILTIIESAGMLMLVLMGMFFSGWILTMLKGGQMAGADLSGMGMIKTVLIVSLLISAVLYILQIIASSKVMKLKKSGYTMYLIVAGLLSLLLIVGLVQNFSLASLIYLIFKLLMLFLVFIGFKKAKA
ncbi:MAG: hypothetical protein GXP45_01555 [bacterium]|nr:hypothetical protein [bacterium]